MSDSPTRVYIIEDHEAVREAFRSLLGEEPGLVVCGEAESAERALEEVPGLDPDLLLVDVSLPGMSGLDLLARLPPGPRSIVVTAHSEPHYRDRAFEVGASGFVSKYDGSAALLAAIHDVVG